jgi:mono/diheme cytochrome c family protein
MPFAIPNMGKVKRSRIIKEEPSMIRNKNKLIAIILFSVFVVLMSMSKNVPVGATASAADEPAAIFKAKCAMCHSPKAEKFYDPSRPDEEQVQAILKGKKGEKPPYMPAFETKGITEDDAKALAAYMKSLRTPAN